MDVATLDAALDAAWTQLSEGVRNRRHGFHTPTLATLAPDGQPQARVMVLRRAEPARRVALFHCDVRSPKASEVRADPRAALLFYDFKNKTQVRATARAEVLTDDPDVEAAWERTRLQSRRCYLAPHPPTADTGDADEPPPPNLPEHLIHRDPTEEESEAGRANFAVIRCHLKTLDWLYLEHTGHRRARFEWNGERWLGRWVEP